MPFSVQWDGADELLRKMDKLQEKAAKIAAEALYEGAGVMADAVSQAVKGIATEEFRYATGGRKRMPSPEEKEIVMKANAGIAKFNKDGTEVDTSVGYRNSGYAELNGKKKPIPVIVNSINSGTSFMNKQPFVRKAANNGGKKAMEAMKKVIETEFEALTKN